MNKISFLENTKALIAEGNIDRALDDVMSFLEADQAYKKLHTEVLHLSNVYHKTRQDEVKRTISFENAELSYGKVRQGLINLLEFIEKDEFNPDGLLTQKLTLKKVLANNKWLFIVGLPLMLIGAAVLILVLRLDKPENEDCTVEFDNDVASNFLVLPFYNPTGDDLQPAGLIVERLEEFCAGITSLKDSDFEICDSYKPNKLLNYEDAAVKGKNNKAAIVIWGRAERSNATTVIKTRYKYLGNKDKEGKVPFTRLNQEGEQEVSTDKVLSIITSSGELTQNLENTLMLMVGMIANLEGDQQGAIRAMHAAQVTDSSANLMKYMVLADNYLAMNEPEKAKAALDTCLEVNPNYWLGRDNRASLRMESGDYLGAVEDLTVALKKQPDDARLLIARGKAYKQSQQLYAAKKDFEKAIKMKPAAEPQLRETIKETNVEIKRLEKIVAPTKVNISSTKLSNQQYLAAAEASNKLGDIATTKKLVTKGLEFDFNNPKLIAIQVDNLLKENELAKAKQVLEAAVSRKVSKEEIAKHSKNVASLIKRMDQEIE